jgi:hypothetical protein
MFVNLTPASKGEFTSPASLLAILAGFVKCDHAQNDFLGDSKLAALNA